MSKLTMKYIERYVFPLADLQLGLSSYHSLLVLKDISKRSIRTAQVLPLRILAMQAFRIGKSSVLLLDFGDPEYLVSFFVLDYRNFNHVVPKHLISST